MPELGVLASRPVAARCIVSRPEIPRLGSSREGRLGDDSAHGSAEGSVWLPFEGGSFFDGPFCSLRARTSTLSRSAALAVHRFCRTTDPSIGPRPEPNSVSIYRSPRQLDGCWASLRAISGAGCRVCLLHATGQFPPAQGIGSEIEGRAEAKGETAGGCQRRASGRVAKKIAKCCAERRVKIPRLPPPSMQFQPARLVFRRRMISPRREVVSHFSTMGYSSVKASKMVLLYSSRNERSTHGWQT